MVATIPDWLARHGGSLRRGADGNTWFVLLGNEPQYRLVPVPVAGKYGCQVTEIVNGKRLDSGTGASPAPEDALRAGLEELRKSLGW